LSTVKRPGRKRGGVRSELVNIASPQIAGAVDADVHLRSELTDRTTVHDPDLQAELGELDDDPATTSRPNEP
jgi:hypothetical protein